MSSSREYHAQRARTERDIAYRAADGRVSDVHMRLSVLHLGRSLVLEEVERCLGAERPAEPNRPRS
jgi:hypothetical protein